MTAVRLIHIPNPFDFDSRRVRHVELAATAGALIDRELRPASGGASGGGTSGGGGYHLTRAGLVIDADTPLAPGDEIIAIRLPEGLEIGAILTTALIGAAISAGLSALVTLLIGPPGATNSRDGRTASPTYNWDGIVNSTTQGQPRAIIFGRHRVGGQIISHYRRNVSANSLEQNLYVVLSLGRGPLTKIGHVTHDADRLSSATEFVEHFTDLTDADLQHDEDWVGSADAWGDGDVFAAPNDGTMTVAGGTSALLAPKAIHQPRAGTNSRAGIHITNVTTGGECGIAINADDADNYHALVMTTATNIRLLKRVAGSDTTIDNFTAATGEEWELGRFGDELRVYKDGELQDTFSADPNLTSRRVGLLRRPGTGSLTIDRFWARAEETLPEGLQINGVDANTFRRVDAWVRMGHENQAQLAGNFSKVIQAWPVGLPLDTAWHRYRFHREVGGFHVNLDFPGGFFDQSGESLDHVTAEIEIEYRASESEVWTPIAGSPFTLDFSAFSGVTDAPTSPFAYTIFHDPGDLAGSAQEIRIRRVNREQFELDSRIHDRIVLGDINEVEREDRQSYNGNALLALEIRASDQLSGASPTITVPVEGLEVPTWDGESGDAAAPILDLEWSNNPAWIVLWILLDRVDGLGNWFTTADIDFDAFRAWAEFCDQNVSYWDFESEPLFETTETDPIDEGERAVTITSSGDAAEFAIGDFVRVELEPINRIVDITEGDPGAEVLLHNPVERDYGEGWRLQKVQITDQISEAGHTFDGVFDTELSAWEAILRVCRAGRAVPLMNGRRISVRWEDAATPVQLIADAAMIRGSMAIEYLGSTDQTDIVEVQYLDAAQNYDQVVEHSGGFPPANVAHEPVTRTVQMYGITRRSQARREADYQLKAIKYARKRLTFQMALDGLAAEPGDVIEVASTLPAWTHWTGRATGTLQAFTVDHPVTLEADAEYVILIRTADALRGVSAAITSAAGTYAPGDTITTDAEDDDAIAEAVAVIGGAGMTSTLWRIAKTTLQPDLRIEVEAVEYDPRIYALTGWTSSPEVTDLPPTAKCVAPGQYLFVPANHVDFEAQCGPPATCGSIACCFVVQADVTVQSGGDCVELGEPTEEGIPVTVIGGECEQICLRVSWLGQWVTAGCGCPPSTPGCNPMLLKGCDPIVTDLCWDLC